MELRDLRIFVLSARFLNFSKVADTLYMTQPSVSKYIANLEDELGDALFERSIHSLKLSSFGQQFLPYAQQVLAAEENARMFAAAHSAQFQTTLRIGISEPIELLPATNFVLVLIKSITEIQRQDPAFHVIVQTCQESDILTSINRGIYDIAFFPQIRSHAPKSPDNSIQCLPIIQSRSYLMYAPQFRNFENFEEVLAGTDIISYLHDPISEEILHILQNDYQCVPVLHPFEHWPGLLVDVSEGLSVGLVSDPLLKIGTDAGLSFVPLDGEQFYADIYMTYQPSSRSAKDIFKLRDAMQKTAGNTGSP